MAKSTGCKRAPEINGELSLLYLDLFDMLKNKYKLDAAAARQVTNVIYVLYASNDLLKASLDNLNKARNSQDLHSADDVFDAIGGDELVKYAAIDGMNELNSLSISEGVKLDTVHNVEFTNWEDAYTKALDINTAHPTLSAYVIQLNGKYIVKINNMTSLNMADRVTTDIENQLMQLLKNALASVNLNIDDITFAQDTFFGRRYNNLVSWIRNIPKTDPKYLMKDDLKMLISLFQREQIVDRIITKFGGIDDLVDAYYGWYRGTYTATPTTETQLKAAMDLMLSFNGLDVDALYTNSKDLTDQIKNNSVDYNARLLWEKLNDAFKLDSVSILTSIDRLNTIREVIALTIKSLGVEANALRGDSLKAVRDDLLNRIEALDKDLEQRQYTSGLAEFLTNAATRLLDMLHELVVPISLGADMNDIHQRGSALRRAAQYMQVYKPIIESISKLDGLERDIDITDLDVLRLQAEAAKLNNTIVEINLAIKNSIDMWAKLALSLMLVENSEITIDDVMDNLKVDATWFDRMYNVTKVSQIPTAVIGNYILETRRLRTMRLAHIADRIGAILLTKDPVTGKSSNMKNRNTSFMYELVDSEFGGGKKEYKIISEYDFNKYYELKRKLAGRLKKRGVTGAAFNLAMEAWVNNNTDTIVVDLVTNRTERVPKVKKAQNPLDKLSETERAIYDLFLDLKGEIDSMLPEFARSRYNPPQLRKNALDLLGLGKVGKAVAEKYKSNFSVREDEEGFGLIKETDDGEVISTYTDMTGSTDIVPVNYVQKLKNQDELLLNFSEGLLHLASSAINYDIIKGITDTVEVLSDYVVDKVHPMLNGLELAQTFTYGTKLFYEVGKRGKHDISNVERILQDLKKRLLYNDTTAGRSVKVTKGLNFIRKVTSVLALSFNLFGAMNNALEGYRKNLEEAITYGTDTFDLVDLEWAHAVIFGLHPLEGVGHIKDFLTGKRTHKGSLIVNRFDPKKEKYHEIANRKYRTNFFRTLVSKDLTMIMYGFGETLNNLPIIYAMLHHVKVTIDGKKGTLYDALEVRLRADGTSELALKPKVINIKTGKHVTDADLDELAKKMNEVSETNHGGMSDEAKGEIASTLLGMMTLQLRRWMIGVYSKYFRGEYFDASTGKKREGAWKGAYDFLSMIAKDMKGMPWSLDWGHDMRTFSLECIKNWHNFKPHQRKAAVSFATTTVLMTVLSWLVDGIVRSYYPSDKDEIWFKVVFYLLARQRMDVQSTVPDLKHLERVGLIGTSMIEIMDKPFASYSTIEMATYWVTALPEQGEEVKSGPHKGEDKYLRGLSKHYVKPLELYYRLEGLKDTDELIESLGGLKGKFSVKKEYERLTGEEYKEKKSVF